MIVRNISRLFDVAGFNALMRRMTRNRIVVLMYHGLVDDTDPVDAWTFVRAGQFERQMEYLSRHYEVITLRNALTQVGSSAGRKRVVITFDDGYASNYRLAFPILKKYGLPASVFVSTRFVETGDMFWYDKVSAAVQLFNVSKVDLANWGLGTFTLATASRQTRWTAIQRILTRMKELPSEERERIAAQLLEKCSDKDLSCAAAYEPLSPVMLAEMKASGLIEIGSHTHGHELLVQHDSNEVRETLKRANSLFVQWIGEVPPSFSYPNGDYDDKVKKYVCDAGHDCALTTEANEWLRNEDPLQIPRIGIGAYHTMSEFAVKVSGNSRVLNVLWNLFARTRFSFKGP